MEVYFPTLADALAAPTPTPPDTAPQRVRVDGRAQLGDGGAALYDLQPAALPLEGSNLLDGTWTGWTLAVWTIQSNRLGPNSGDDKTAEKDFAFVRGKAYRLSFNVVNSGGGNWFAYVVDGDGKAVLLATSSSGNCNVTFTANSGDARIRITGSTYFLGTIGVVSLRERSDQGQQTIMGSTYLPIPLDGVLRPEMFGTGEGANDDAGFRRLFLRINSLVATEPNVRLEMTGQYSCVDTGYLLSVPKGIDLTIDGKGTGLVDITGVVATTPFWLEVLGPGYDYSVPPHLKTTLDAAVAAGALTLPVASNTGFDDGDWVAVTSTWEYFSGIIDTANKTAPGFAPINKGELIQIRDAAVDPMALGSSLSHSYAQHATDPTTYPVNVRRIGMAGSFVLQGLRAVGPADATSITNVGKGFLHVRHFAQVAENHVTLENFPAFSARYTLCGSISMDTPRTLGRRFDHCNTDSEWFYGREIYGCSRASILSPIGEYCRRSIDLHEATLTHLASDQQPREAVISQNITMIGGHTIQSRTMPGGHYSYNVELIGHIGRNVAGQIRGKNVRWIGVDINSGIAVGADHFEDPALYPTVDPSVGVLELIDCSMRNTNSGSFGVVVRHAFDKLVIRGCTIRADNPVELYGRHQSNVEIADCDIEGVAGTNPVIAGYIVGNQPSEVLPGNLPNKVDASNWNIRDNRLANGTIAVYHAGAKIEEVKNIRIVNNRLENISTNHLALTRGIGSLWSGPADLELANNVEMGSTLPASKTDIGGLQLSSYGNNFAGQSTALTPASGVLTLPKTRSNVIVAHVLSTAAATITTINGLQAGQMLLLRKQASSYTLTLQDDASGGNLRLSGDLVLDSSHDRVLLVGYDTDVVQLSFSSNA
ncbi:hypothetical protein LGR54_05045 [Ancylobacter sp. Lp-2]|uniref:right-handed parallel beta-helix repeat-containing protein n=1 Tax=Ancylobacter sp. Lp-2 TaxID=2881339 RepID=UPI001E5D1387|nr:right-handed parallel beta-helix repeat-containing protein [Ancylobacter sp. Lp-2]MCB4767963.1 hypothetical protein [Ancylobacter sp. Lp-2]